jgi:pyridoxamine 5'-phosphate oxidase-like protein
LSAITRASLLHFLRSHRLAVQASIAGKDRVQAAVVGIAVTDRFELIFDTLTITRKARNLARNPHIAFVIGGSAEGEDESVQYEGIADLPAGAELETLQTVYFRAFPDGQGRLAWPGIRYFRVKPRWLRYSNYRIDPPLIVELDAAELGRLA